MLYCFNGQSFPNNKRANEDIKYAKAQGTFIYYDEEKNMFLDASEKVVDVSNKRVMPVSFVKQLPALINALTSSDAIIPNTLDEINMVEEWYKYIEPKRLIVPFTGRYLQEAEFITYLIEVFSPDVEVFLKTKNKDFSGIVTIEDLINPDSDLRAAFAYHEDEEFILSEKVTINYDEIGNQEYRVFVFQNQIMNISRVTDTTYHQIPLELLDYLEELLKSLPADFPRTFVVDIFSYQNMYDIVEFNPLEASGKYLYNSIFTISTDLTHEDITNVPEERDQTNLSFESEEDLTPSTLKRVSGTFAKDYDDIKRFGKRVNGFVHIHGLPEGVKIDLDSIFAQSTPIETDADLHNQENPKLSLTNPHS